jgi:methyl-accepting chemotaxis protein
MSTQPQFKRRIFVVDRPFQLRFSFYVVSWIFGLSLIYPLIIYNLYDALIQFSSSDPLGPSSAHLQNSRDEVLKSLVFLQLLFSGVIFIISIFMSHRIAGPIYKLRLFLKKAKDGDLASELHFRHYDHFQSLAVDYNSMIEGLRGIYGHQVSSAQAALIRIQSALPHIESGEARRELEEAMIALQEVADRVQLPTDAPSESSGD